VLNLKMVSGGMRLLKIVYIVWGPPVFPPKILNKQKD